MRIGILSDTHDQIGRLNAAIHLLRGGGAEVFVHCGDITHPETVAVCATQPCYFVFGNHDSDRVPALESAIAEAGAVWFGWSGDVMLAGKRIAIAHGHMTTDIRRLLSAHPDYLLFGHSHNAGDWYEGGTRHINPGASDKAKEFSVAILDLEADGLTRFVLSD